MHLSLLLIKTRLKSRKLIVFIHFFSFRARKQILPRGSQRKFGEVKDCKSPSQPLKKKMIGSEGKRLVEKSEKRCRAHRGHENNRPWSNSFDPGGSHQANSQVGEMEVWSISWLDCTLLQKKPAYGPAVVMVMHETISSTDGLKATCESFGMQSYCFMMHLNSLSLKTRLKLRKLIVFIRFFFFQSQEADFSQRLQKKLRGGERSQVSFSAYEKEKDWEWGQEVDWKVWKKM